MLKEYIRHVFSLHQETSFILLFLQAYGTVL